MKEQIEQDIKRILTVRGFTAFNEINLDSKIEEDLDLDSLDKVEFLMELESKFNITIRDEDATSILTIGELVDYINDRIESRKYA